ncbi:hypothetical protein MTO96_020775 [Rhipicephalus appendiculatus]
MILRSKQSGRNRRAPRDSLLLLRSSAAPCSLRGVSPELERRKKRQSSRTLFSFTLFCTDEFLAPSGAAPTSRRVIAGISVSYAAMPIDAQTGNLADTLRQKIDPAFERKFLR